MNQALYDLFLRATWETLLMTGASGAASLVVGLPSLWC